MKFPWSLVKLFLLGEPQTWRRQVLRNWYDMLEVTNLQNDFEHNPLNAEYTEYTRVRQDVVRSCQDATRWSDDRYKHEK